MAIYERLGERVLTMLWRDPSEVFIGIPGITSKRMEDIGGWLEVNKPRLGMQLVLHRLGFGEGMRERIGEHFKDADFMNLRENPYQLLSIPGIGFQSLDKRVLGGKLVSRDSPVRAEAALTHCLDRLTNRDGHTRVQERLVLRELSKSYGIPEGVSGPALDRLKMTGNLVVQGEDLMTCEMEEFETRICDVLTGQASGSKFSVPKRLPELDDDQQDALRVMLESPFSILTGGPGTGKTYTINSFIKVVEAEGMGSITLCAPTGKAAKRMSEATGRPASTIHSLLGRGKVGENLVIDEASMLSTDLAAEVASMVKKSSPKRLILVGDPDQLPSIGPGRVFDDLIDSGAFPVARLEKIRRQTSSSNIIVNAGKIRRGEPLVLDNSSDFRTSFVPLDAQERLLLKTFTHGIPRLRLKDGSALDPINDVQVIAPQHRGQLGCIRLNRLLQDLLNPAAPGDPEWAVAKGDQKFSLREGDKVIFTKNCYDFGLINGETGRIESIGDEGVSVLVDTPEGDSIKYLPKSNDPPITLGYAITVHKVQGSEAPMVIVIYNSETPPMFRVRNMLYTATTRAKELCYIIGNEDVVNESIANTAPDQRKTGLISKLDGRTLPKEAEPEMFL